MAVRDQIRLHLQVLNLSVPLISGLISGSKLIVILMVFLKDILENIYLKKSANIEIHTLSCHLSSKDGIYCQCCFEIL